MSMNDNETMWIAAATVLFVVIALVIFINRRKALRNAELRERFGPEYDRAVAEFGGERRAARELAARARRVDHIRITELSAPDRVRFMSAWSRLQERFVDDPAAAAVGASELIKQVMRARGYPIDDFEQRAADLSVDHPGVVQHYRAARALVHADATQPISTENLRQAVVHYRALFAELLREPDAAVRAFTERHA